MKKLILIIGVLTLVSCGDKPKTSEEIMAENIKMVEVECIKQTEPKIMILKSYLETVKYDKVELSEMAFEHLKNEIPCLYYYEYVDIIKDTTTLNTAVNRECELIRAKFKMNMFAQLAANEKAYQEQLK